MQKMVAMAGFVVVILLALLAISSVVNRFDFSVKVLQGSTVAEITSERSESMPPEVASMMANFDQRYAEHPWLTLIHIIPGFLFMVLGPIQFMPSIRNRWIRFHRLSGRIFVASSLVAVFTALLFVAWLPVYGTFTASVAVVFGSVLFLFSLVKAMLHIRRREIVQHREWMMRTFAIGLGIATFRALIPILISPLFGVSFPEAWDTVVWLGFALNVLVAEVWINVTRPQRVAQARVVTETATPKPA